MALRTLPARSGECLSMARDTAGDPAPENLSDSRLSSDTCRSTGDQRVPPRRHLARDGRGRWRAEDQHERVAEGAGGDRESAAVDCHSASAGLSLYRAHNPEGFLPPAAVMPAPVAPLPVPGPALVIPSAPVSGPTPAPRLVGREAEVATLRQWFANALQGERHLGFITGEAGIGKTTLVDTFVAQLTDQAPLWLGRGQCIEQYGAGEAYLPLLEALGQMGRTPDGPHLVTLLRQQAPSWVLQLPALLSPGEYEALQQYAGGTTRERMLRELAEAMEALTAVRPCVLVLEDLHWSDTATIEWLAYMARRRGPARLLVLGTYRPVETMVRVHPVRAMVQELMVHGHGAELALEEWSEAGVAAYLAQRGAGAEAPAAWHERWRSVPKGIRCLSWRSWTSCCGSTSCVWSPLAGFWLGDSTQ